MKEKLQVNVYKSIFFFLITNLINFNYLLFSHYSFIIKDHNNDVKLVTKQM